MTSILADHAGAPPQGASSRSLPVIEIFGPTIQGEGPEAGRPAYFVRFGGCDFRCDWCDSMYAVDPAEVRANSRSLDTDAIVAHISELAVGPNLVVLSGGNPALFELGALVAALHKRGLDVAIETQGSRWKQWLAEVDCLVVSPKGPSSGMDTPDHRRAFSEFMRLADEVGTAPVLKAVIFDEADLEYARWLAATWPNLALYLSTGTDVGLAEQSTIRLVLERLRWLSETVARDPVLQRARVGAQQHVLAWGIRRGV